MNNLEISFPQNIQSFDPGAEIAVKAIWDLDETPAKIEARLVWHTTGKGDRDLKVVKTVVIDHPPARDEQFVNFALPWGPYSFSGKLISLVWGIELVVSPGNNSVRSEIVVAPHGTEVLLRSAGID